MELKYSGQALIYSAVVLLALGIVTGGLVFYFLMAAIVAALALDYFRCRAILRDLVRHLTVSRHMSGEVAPGSNLDLAYDLNYTGNRSFFLRCIQPTDPKDPAPAPAQEIFLGKGGNTVGFTLKPGKCGKYLVPGLRLVSQSSLFRGTVSGVGNCSVNVCVPISGTGLTRQCRGSIQSSPIVGLEMTMHRGGCDFSGIRNYLPGDSIRYIDWARSSKSQVPVVRDFEESRVMPLLLLIDTDGSMQTGEPLTELDSAVKFAMSISREMWSNYERVGLACFSREDVTRFLPPGSGKVHLAQLMNMLLSLETTGDTLARPLYMPALHEAAIASKALAGSPDLQPMLAVMDGAVDHLAANVLQDGFVKAVNRASQAGTRCHVVVLTNLSMGVASMISGIRLACYSGHRVTVLLMPHIWYQSPDQADPGQLSEKYRRVREAVSLMRSMNANVIEVCPRDQPERIAGGYQHRGLPRRM